MSRDEDLDTIARWMGYALEGCIHGFNLRRRAESTIRVQQTKEKFGEIRVHCDLADEDLVREEWEKNEPVLVVSEEFTMKCLKWDRYHYNRVYADAQRLFPQYAREITGAADFKQLTHATPEAAAQYLRDQVMGKCGWTWNGDDPVQHREQVAKYRDEYLECWPDLHWDISLIPSLEELLALPRPSQLELQARRHEQSNKLAAEWQKTREAKALGRSFSHWVP